MFERICTALSALTFLGLGVAFLVDPVVLGDVVGISLPSSTAIIELSTFYGGLEVGIGFFLFTCLFTPHFLRTGLILQTMMFGFCAAARLFGIIRYSGEDEIIYWLFLSEALFALLCYRALLINTQKMLRI